MNSQTSSRRADCPHRNPRPPNPLSYSAAGFDVKDEVTGLVWRKAPEQAAAAFTFEQALAACTAVEPVGTWRLPKRIELATLLDYARPAAFIDKNTFKVNTVRAWTSS